MALMFLSRKRNKRSNVPLSFTKVTDMSVGTLYPVAMVDIVTDDVVHFAPSTFLQAFAMKAPLVNGFKLCLEYFFAPDRLYHGRLLLNETGVTDQPFSVIFPCTEKVCPSTKPISSGVQPFSDEGDRFVFTFPGTQTQPGVYNSVLNVLTDQMVKPGSILDFMGFPVGYFPSHFSDSSKIPAFPAKDDLSSDRYFVDITKYMAYLDIFLNYYANQQFEQFYTAGYLRTVLPDDSSKASDGSIFRQVTRSLFDLQDFINGLKRSDDPASYIANTEFTQFCQWPELCKQSSLFQRSLPPYYLEQWLNTSYGSLLNNTVKVDVDKNSVSFVDIREKSHIQRFMELAMAGGSRYSDYMNAQFDASRIKNSTVPIYLGSDRQFLGSRVIYQTTGFDSDESPLGSFAGQASGGDRHKKRSFKFGENGTFIVMASLVPDTIYYRGIEPSVHRFRLGSKYVPALDNVGMEPLAVEQLDALPPVLDLTSASSSGTDAGISLTMGSDVPVEMYDQQRAVGFVPAWSSYMQSLSRIHGSIQGSLKYWTLARDYALSSMSTKAELNIAAFLEQAQVAASTASVSVESGAVEAARTFFDNIRGADESVYTPYILNHLYNSVFADVSPDARNFVLTFSADMTVNREKSKVNIPNTI